jgi:hypothetical protein
MSTQLKIEQAKEDIENLLKLSDLKADNKDNDEAIHFLNEALNIAKYIPDIDYKSTVLAKRNNIRGKISYNSYAQEFGIKK